MGAFDPMTKSGATICPISPGHLTGLAAIKLSVILAFVQPALSAMPLVAYIFACAALSLMPTSRFFLPVISRGHTGRRIVALTFDDGPDPATTEKLLDLLSRHNVKATFFIPGRRASRFPELVRKILSGGHDVGNHSYSHDPFLMLRSKAVIEREIASGQEMLTAFGVVPLAFRPPVGTTNPRLWRILLGRGLVCVTFNRRAGDFGNRRIQHLADRILRKVGPDDIVMLHDVMPGRGMDVDMWLQEIEKILVGLKGKGLAVTRLSEVIGQPVMVPADAGAAANPVASFYDHLADDYDHEQFASGVSLAKRKESEAVLSRLPELVSATDRVLEIGAGTGIFSMPIAGICRELIAVDVSGRMLSVLERKAEAAHRNNIRCMAGNIMTMDIPGTFDTVCAFSSLEYIPDMAGLFKKLAPHLNPGGRFYFTTAHCSFFRFFTQIGNAMRQGLWLHARTKREVVRMLAAAGMRPVRIETHLMKIFPGGGMILEIEAIKD